MGIKVNLLSLEQYQEVSAKRMFIFATEMIFPERGGEAGAMKMGKEKRDKRGRCYR